VDARECTVDGRECTVDGRECTVDGRECTVDGRARTVDVRRIDERHREHRRADSVGVVQRRFSAPDIDFESIRTELGICEDYGAAALDEAEHAVDAYADERADRRDIPLVTIDPPGSMDLDQAVAISFDDDGFLVHYAIADVAALVRPEGALDAESRRRGATIYFPDGSVPLHPRVLSEGSGSLLPGASRPAVLWTIRVAPDGEVTEIAVARGTRRVGCAVGLRGCDRRRRCAYLASLDHRSTCIRRTPTPSGVGARRDRVGSA